MYILINQKEIPVERLDIPPKNIAPIKVSLPMGLAYWEDSPYSKYDFELLMSPDALLSLHGVKNFALFNGKTVYQCSYDRQLWQDGFPSVLGMILKQCKLENLK